MAEDVRLELDGTFTSSCLANSSQYHHGFIFQCGERGNRTQPQLFTPSPFSRRISPHNASLLLCARWESNPQISGSKPVASKPFGYLRLCVDKETRTLTLRLLRSMTLPICLYPRLYPKGDSNS